MAIYQGVGTLDDFGRLRRTPPLYTDGRAITPEEQERQARAATAGDATNIIAQALASLMRDLDYQPPLPGAPEYQSDIQRQAAQISQVDLGPDPGPHFQKSKRGGFVGAMENVGKALLFGLAAQSPEFHQRLAEDRAYHRQLALAQEQAQERAYEQAMTVEKIRNMRRQQKLELLKTAKDFLKQEPDKHIGQYTNDQGQQVVIMQRPDGSVYETPLGRVYREQKPERPSIDQLLSSADPQERARGIAALKEKARIEAMYRQSDTGLPKDAIAAAQNKLLNINLARQQLQQVKAKLANIGDFSLLPTRTAKEFDASVDALRQTVTALTRTPGLGSMSDYETRLAQAPLPSRGDLYKQVSEQKVSQLETLLNTLESGYRSQLGLPAAAPRRRRYNPQTGRIE